ncbi:MAG: ATP-binding cassette domain-containing protein [Candidatus Zixiibacteriota bacterium]|nr:MAG: ATP-binding cassette domain-containing protein [candidate division Zixibacteria bacterium]
MAKRNSSLNTDIPILETVGLSRFVRDGGNIKTILDDFSYSFGKGCIYTIIGPSGAGKSSLLRLLNRLDEPTGGDILFGGKNTKEFAPCYLRRLIGHLFQTPYLFPKTVRDNFLYADSKLPSGTVERLAEQVQIPSSMIDRDVETLSIGEKQRVALARLLATNPEVVLLDEPTSALDPSYTESIENLVKNIISHRTLTVIMVTHNPEQALRMDGETILMVAGRLVESGPCERVIKDPQTEEGHLYKAKRLK